MKNPCLALAAMLAFASTAANAADLPQPNLTAPPPDPTTPTWFLDLNYTYAVMEGHTANFASPFIDHSSTSVGTLVGNSAWRAEAQRVGLTINKAF